MCQSAYQYVTDTPVYTEIPDSSDPAVVPFNFNLPSFFAMLTRTLIGLGLK
jgi:hypothetical protein